MSDCVVAFVGENANGILEWWTDAILKGFERHGLKTRLVDFGKPTWPDALATVLNTEKLAFAFSFQGIGAHIADQGQNVWAKLNVPFYTYLGDSPYHFPQLHWHPTPRTYMLYSCQDFLETYTKYLKGPAAAFLHPYGFPDNPHARKIRWRKREIEIVYVKTGIDPAGFTARWDAYPRPFRSIIFDAAAVALTGTDDTIADIVAQRCAAESFDWGRRTELFFTIASDVDHYVRAVRAAKMAQLLMKLPTRIYGPGWDFLDRTGCKATFHGNIPAHDLMALYANSKILASTTPSVRHGMHERVMAGLLSRSAVLSDLNPYSRAVLADYPAFRGADIDSDDFEAQAMAQLELPGDFDDALEHSYTKALASFSMENFIAPLLAMMPMDELEARAVNFRAG